MKKAIIALTLILMLSMLNGCNGSNDSKPIQEDKPVVSNEVNKNSIVDTLYYTLEIPKSWDNDCFYETVEDDSNNYTVSFYDKKSYDESVGGWLFSIKLLTEEQDYSAYPSCQVLGSLEVYRIGVYNIIVTFPTDVQFSESTTKKYNEMCDKVPDILKTISYKNECTFSSDPLPITENKSQGTNLISGNFIGKWFDLGTVGKAPNGASSWNVEFRSDATGTFELVYEKNDVVSYNFNYSRYDTYLGEGTDGILIEVDGGKDIRFMTRYTWSNELQKTLMTMYEVKSSGAPNLDVCWLFYSN